MQPALTQQSIALQLGGGGARAAYQVGVLKAIADFYPRNHGLPFPILCGTSAGAINTATLACFASCFHLGVRKLEWVWRQFKTEQVYRSSYRGVSAHLGRMILNKHNQQGASLLSNQPLRELLQTILPLHRIEQHCQAGYLKAITIAASRYYHPSSVSFFQGSDTLSKWQRHLREGVRTQLTVEHLMASSAIPLVFPSVRLVDDYYGDGSILQLSPLSPPIHLGAKKILIINLDSPHHLLPLSQRRRSPDMSEIAGHLLDTIFSDTLNSDLERLERINNTLSYIPSETQTQLGLKQVETLVIKPSQDLDLIAQKYYANLPPAIRLLLKTIGVNQHSDTSLLSYLMFESDYCCELIQLGYHDGQMRRGELKYFFNLD